MLRIHIATRQEPLLKALAESLRTDAHRDPLQPDLLVAERGTDRWLWQYLAEQHGIAANLRIEPPAAFLWRMLRHYFPDTPTDARFDAGPLRWRIAQLLPRLLAEREFASLANYLAGDDGRKLHQLATRLAALFNDYMIYRPTMIVGWQQGKLTTQEVDERWQQKLWKALTDTCGDTHRATLIQRFFTDPSVRSARPPQLPVRAAIFGIPALPPVYVQMLIALGEHIDIDLYVLNPCRQFWGELGDPKKIKRDDEGFIESTDVSNALLASWGQPIRHFISELYGHTADSKEYDESTAYAQDTLLQRLQHDIRELTQTPSTLADHDDSIRIVSAWGAMREVEILHDELLGRFQRDAALKPRDVLVMVPAIEQYAPMIEAVFGAADGERFIPWAITDVSRRGAHPITAAIEQLLHLPDSRFAASEVFGLLETPAIARRFGFDVDTLTVLREALQAANLHGDLDAASRAERGLPAESTHSWQFALQRLFLGVAMSEQHSPVLGVLPEQAFEGKASAVLGRLQSFIDMLALWKKRLSHPQTAQRWMSCIHRICADFFKPDDDEQDLIDDVLKAARDLFDEAQAGSFDEEISGTVFRDDFLGRLRAPASRGNLRSGGVTFCGMVPMRSLPFKVIAVIGLNNEHYPRQQRASGFDLISRVPLAGDRSRRHDDRHLFLETLLSARDALYLSFSGRNAQDGSAREPSVLVRELMDQIVSMHSQEKSGEGKSKSESESESESGEKVDPDELRKTIVRQLMIEHPLQPFSARYFTPALNEEPTLSSYDRDWLLPERAGHDAKWPPFCAEPLTPLEESAAQDISLDALARFFENPAQAFLRHRFGVSFFDKDALFDDVEPFELDVLTTRTLENELLAHRLSGGSAKDFRTVIQARGDLPQAAFFDVAWRGVAESTEPFAQALTPVLAQRQPLNVDLFVETSQGRRRVCGQLNTVTPTGLVLYRVGKLRGKHKLSAWVKHLCFLLAIPATNGAGSVSIEPVTTYFARGDGDQPKEHRFDVVDDPRAILTTLVELYLRGQNQPLPLLPACSEAWALHEDDAKKAEKSACKAWEGDDYGGMIAERDNAAVRIVFGDDEPPFDADFRALASLVFAPLLAAMNAGPSSRGDDA